MVDHLLFIKHAVPDPSKADTTLAPMPQPKDIEAAVAEAKQEERSIERGGKPASVGVGGGAGSTKEGSDRAAGAEAAVGTAAAEDKGRAAMEEAKEEEASAGMGRKSGAVPRKEGRAAGRRKEEASAVATKEANGVAAGGVKGRAAEGAAGQERDAREADLGNLGISDASTTGGRDLPPPSFSAPASQEAGETAVGKVAGDGVAAGAMAGGAASVGGRDSAPPNLAAPASQEGEQEGGGVGETAVGKVAGGAKGIAANGASVLDLFAFSEHHVLLWETAALTRLGGALSRLAATEVRNFSYLPYSIPGPVPDLFCPVASTTSYFWKRPRWPDSGALSAASQQPRRATLPPP
jgi:hypothetical protein